MSQYLLQRGMVCAPQPYAVDAGVAVLAQGGNAFDAALVAALVQGVVNPHMSGPGGYMLLTQYRPETGAVEAVDGPALAGALTSPDMWEDRYQRPNPMGWGFFLKDHVNDAGYTSICTPGTIKGFQHMLEQWGTLSWGDLFAPAVAMAEEGHKIMARTANVWLRQPEHPEELVALDYVKSNAEASRIYLQPDGTPYRVGHWFRNPDYGKSLRHLAKYGADDFYRGEFGERMAQDIALQGGYVTHADFQNYELPPAEGVKGTFGEYEITSAPAPHGGPTLIAILNIMETFQDEPGLAPDSPRFLYLLGMAMKAAFADRNPYMADPRCVEVPLDWMISKERAAHWHDVIVGGEPIHVAFTFPGSPDTTHVTVVDKWGNCVALTTSLGSSSGVITPGLGFMYNNSMINFQPLPGHLNSIAPGKARTTGMAPTVVTRQGRPILVLGAPGATRILNSIAQVVLNCLMFGMDVTAAVDAPRIDCQGDEILVQARVPQMVCDEIAQWHPVTRLAYSRGGLALVHAIAIDADSSVVTGAADAGADGMAVGI